MNVGVGKPESLATRQWKLHTVICFDVLPACDGQTDRQTDTPFVTKSRSDIAERDKNDENEKQSDNRVQFRLDAFGKLRLIASNINPFMGFILLWAQVIIVPRRIIWSWYTGDWCVGCYIWYSEEGLGGATPRPGPSRCTECKCTKCTHPSTASVPIMHIAV